MSAESPMPSLSPEQLYADNGYKLIVLFSVFSVLCIIVVVARFWAPRKREAELWWDDWLCIPSLFFALGLNVINIVMVRVAGVGRHEASFGDEVPNWLGKWAQIVYVELLIYSFAVPLPKLVLLLFYFRIFSNPRFKLAVWAVAIFVIAWCPAVFFTDLFQCSPVALAWDKSIEGGRCINVQAFFRYIVISNVMSDIAVLVLPLPVIWYLQMSIRQKLALTGVFLLGGMGLIASIIRMVEFFERNAFADLTWIAVPLLSWTMVEVEAVLVVACLPLLRSLFIAFWRSSTGFRSKNRHSRKTQEPSFSYVGGVQRQVFARIEELGGIRRTWEVELTPMEAVSEQDYGRAKAFV